MSTVSELSVSTPVRGMARAIRSPRSIRHADRARSMTLGSRRNAACSSASAVPVTTSNVLTP